MLVVNGLSLSRGKIQTKPNKNIRSLVRALAFPETEDRREMIRRQAKNNFAFIPEPVKKFAVSGINKNKRRIHEKRSYSYKDRSG